MSLSEKRTDAWQGRGNIVYPEEDVKESIRLLRARLLKEIGDLDYIFQDIDIIINEIYGKDLI